MKLLINTTPYRLEQDYESGFDPNAFDMMAEVILAFCEPGQDILFSYTNWDSELDPHKVHMVEEAARNFHSDIVSDPDLAISQRVKEVLLNHYAPERDPNQNQVLMEQMFTYFREVPYDELNEELLLKIGSAVHGMQTVYTLEDCKEDTQAFINSRLVDTNTTWLLPYEQPVYLKNILWYRASTKEEVLQSFGLTDWCFSCAIVNPQTSVDQYSFFLNYTEEEDGMVLYISTNTPDYFKETVVPRLERLLGESLEIVE
ncbi:hypothetical protein [Paenibacillus paeoniae]|uniref:Uncharacterized protein n=1 Tax=Paenibacillus paeoniae TaxID=2292705 RepID=A0A371PKR2_9BACL|nr:hypothetical protein [Paenibacillus paeoniae]REK76800.1 hypothetical protein DX130_07145 [Paenibacillus paeoniae]